MNTYKEIEAINQSSLKQILKSPKAYLDAKDKDDFGRDPKHYVLGSLLDEMLLEDSDYIENNYYQMPEISVSDSIKDIIEYVHEVVTVEGIEDTIESGALDELIVKGCGIYNWNPKWGPEARAKNIKANGGIEYFNALKNCNGKTLITALEYNQALIAKMAAISDPYIKPFLVASSDNEIIKKKVIQFTYRNYSCKGEVDLIRIDHKNKLIHPCDIKSLGMSTEYFPLNFWKFRYDFQGSFYSIGLEQDPEIISLMNKGYGIKPFKFIVIDINNNSYPLIYEMPSDVFMIGVRGGTLSNGKVLEGIDQAFDRLDFHLTKGDFTYPKEYYNGPLKLSI